MFVFYISFFRLLHQDKSEKSKGRTVSLLNFDLRFDAEIFLALQSNNSPVRYCGVVLIKAVG